MAIKPFVDQQDRMEKARNAIAVTNRSLILTILNHTLIVGLLIVSSRCQTQQRRDRETIIILITGLT